MMNMNWHEWNEVNVKNSDYSQTGVRQKETSNL